jgi:hypothetical protein
LADSIQIANTKNGIPVDYQEHDYYSFAKFGVEKVEKILQKFNAAFFVYLFKFLGMVI